MAAALRAGVPQVPCPVMLDQPHNARTVVRLHCAPGLVPFSGISAQRLSSMVGLVLDPREGAFYRRNAAGVGERVRQEALATVGRCCELIEGAATTRMGIGAPVGGEQQGKGNGAGKVANGDASSLREPLV